MERFQDFYLDKAQTSRKNDRIVIPNSDQLMPNMNMNSMQKKRIVMTNFTEHKPVTKKKGNGSSLEVTQQNKNIITERLHRSQLKEQYITAVPQAKNIANADGSQTSLNGALNNLLKADVSKFDTDLNGKNQDSIQLQEDKKLLNHQNSVLENSSKTGAARNTLKIKSEVASLSKLPNIAATSTKNSASALLASKVYGKSMQKSRGKRQDAEHDPSQNMEYQVDVAHKFSLNNILSTPTGKHAKVNAIYEEQNNYMKMPLPQSDLTKYSTTRNTKTSKTNYQQKQQIVNPTSQLQNRNLQNNEIDIKNMENKSNNTANTTKKSTANNFESQARMKHRRFTETKNSNIITDQQKRMREILMAQGSASSMDVHTETISGQGNIKNNGVGSNSKLGQYDQRSVGGQHEIQVQKLPENGSQLLEQAAKIYMNQKPKRQEGRSGQRTSNLKVTNLDQQKPESKLSGYNTADNTNITNGQQPTKQDLASSSLNTKLSKYDIQKANQSAASNTLPSVVNPGSSGPKSYETSTVNYQLSPTQEQVVSNNNSSSYKYNANNIRDYSTQNEVSKNIFKQYNKQLKNNSVSLGVHSQAPMNKVYMNQQTLLSPRIHDSNNNGRSFNNKSLLHASEKVAVNKKMQQLQSKMDAQINTAIPIRKQYLKKNGVLKPIDRQKTNNSSSQHSRDHGELMMSMEDPYQEHGNRAHHNPTIQIQRDSIKLPDLIPAKPKNRTEKQASTAMGGSKAIKNNSSSINEGKQIQQPILMESRKNKKLIKLRLSSSMSQDDSLRNLKSQKGSSVDQLGRSSMQSLKSLNKQKIQINNEKVDSETRKKTAEDLSLSMMQFAELKVKEEGEGKADGVKGRTAKIIGKKNKIDEPSIVDLQQKSKQTGSNFMNEFSSTQKSRKDIPTTTTAMNLLEQDYNSQDSGSILPSTKNKKQKMTDESNLEIQPLQRKDSGKVRSLKSNLKIRKERRSADLLDIGSPELKSPFVKAKKGSINPTMESIYKQPKQIIGRNVALQQMNSSNSNKRLKSLQNRSFSKANIRENMAHVKEQQTMPIDPAIAKQQSSSMKQPKQLKISKTRLSQGATGKNVYNKDLVKSNVMPAVDIEIDTKIDVQKVVVNQSKVKYSQIMQARASKLSKAYMDNNDLKSLNNSRNSKQVQQDINNMMAQKNFKEQPTVNQIRENDQKQKDKSGQASNESGVKDQLQVKTRQNPAHQQRQGSSQRALNKAYSSPKKKQENNETSQAVITPSKKKSQQFEGGVQFTNKIADLKTTQLAQNIDKVKVKDISAQKVSVAMAVVTKSDPKTEQPLLQGHQKQTITKETKSPVKRGLSTTPKAGPGGFKNYSTNTQQKDGTKLSRQLPESKPRVEHLSIEHQSSQLELTKKEQSNTTITTQEYRTKNLLRKMDTSSASQANLENGRQSATSTVVNKKQLLQPNSMTEGASGQDRAGANSSTLKKPSNSRLQQAVAEQKLANQQKQSLSNNAASALATATKKKKYALDDFDHLGVIGRGNFGQVRLVKHKLTGQLYALKQIQKEKIRGDKHIQHIENEKAILKQMSKSTQSSSQHRSSRKQQSFSQNSFFCGYIESMQDDKCLYLLMEYLPGGELLKQINQQMSLTLEDSIFYLAEVLVAIQQLHEHNIIYRDLKPENILLDGHGHIKLIDFGFSKKLNDIKVDKARTNCGTPIYAAPEVLIGTGYNYKADIWSFGILICEILGGFTPFGPKAMEIGVAQEGNFDSPMSTGVVAMAPQKIIEMVNSGRIILPKNLNPVTRDIVRKILVADPNVRLEIRNIMQHKFFQGVDWQRVAAKQCDPPYVPDVDEDNQQLLLLQNQNTEDLQQPEQSNLHNTGSPVTMMLKRMHQPNNKNSKILGDFHLTKMNQAFENF